MTIEFKYWQHDHCGVCNASATGMVDVAIGPLGDYRYYCDEHEAAVREFQRDRFERQRQEQLARERWARDPR